MKLYCSLTSPYARKVRVLIDELGLRQSVTEVVVDPWSDPTELLHGNPLGKVPALATDDGLVLPDSRLITDYLLAQRDGLAPPPVAAAARWRLARDAQFADGIIDAAVAMVIETMKRPQQYLWQGWLARQRQAIARTLEVLEPGAAALCNDERVGLHEIALGCALAYLDLRFPRLDWRGGHLRISAWYDGFAERPSMRRTRPPA
ncbi:MAG: glutathione S-transferase [Gammaproteobacteria bacterium]|nr:glutathione S-transferase [Gammaproteobacteria bacterium]